MDKHLICISIHRILGSYKKPTNTYQSPKFLGRNDIENNGTN